MKDQCELYTENEMCLLSREEALKLAKQGWDENKEPYRVRESDNTIWISIRALRGIDTSHIDWIDC